MVHFDTAVNMGTVRAAKILQEAVGAKPDGKIGPKTRQAVKTQCDISALDVMTRYCNIRERVYRWIAANRDGADVFLKGWMNRLNALRVEAGITAPGEIGTIESAQAYPMGRIADIDIDSILEGWVKS